MALAWLLHKPAVSAPIIGASKLSHLEQAVAALEISLSTEEILYLEEPYQPHPVLGHIEVKMFHDIPFKVQERMSALEAIDARDRLDGTPKARRMRQIPPETGKLLALLAAGAPPGTVLEVGTSGGYSSLWLTLACRERGDRLVTFEEDAPIKSRWRARLFARPGLKRSPRWYREMPWIYCRITPGWRSVSWISRKTPTRRVTRAWFLTWCPAGFFAPIMSSATPLSWSISSPMVHSDPPRCPGIARGQGCAGLS